ncbi:MAG: hypothetical protein J2P36_36880 [Ktedonobacteraceae bacterium]|nr:hypothetical protein [Ktedonobacteraceae bacterium]
MSRPPTLLRSYELRSSGGLQGIYRGYRCAISRAERQPPSCTSRFAPFM